MGSICGIIHKNKPAEAVTIKDMLSRMAGWKPDYSGYKCYENIGLGSNILFSMDYSPLEEQPFEDVRYIYVYDGRFDNVGIGEWGFSFSKSPTKKEKEEYENHIIEYLRKNIQSEKPGFKGDFAVAAWDKKDKKLIAIRDQLGVRPFYYTETNEVFAFSTEMEALFKIPGVKKEADLQWIADSLSTVKSEKWRTPYKHIFRLLPAHKMVFDGENKKLTRYWDLEVNPKWSGIEENEASGILRDKLFLAIDRRVRHAISLGSELSGGLDSSGVTAIAQKLMKRRNKELTAFSHAFSENNLGKYFPYKDERDFSRALVDFTGVKKHILCTAENYNVVDALSNTLRIQSGPVQQAYNIFSDCLYDAAAEHDIRVILSGFGGDEGITSRTGGYLYELVKKEDWNTLRKHILNQRKQRKTGVIKSIFKYLFLRYFPKYYNIYHDVYGQKDRRTILEKGLALTKAFRQDMKIKERMKNLHFTPFNHDYRMRQYAKITHNHVSQRFEYSYLAALYRRMEYAYPLWDIDLLEFFYSLPTEYKIKEGLSRSIYREAMKSVLPDKIRLREDKSGATVPTVQQRFMNDYIEISEIIGDAQSKGGPGFIDYKKLKTWQERIKERGHKDKIPAHPGAFFNYLQIILWLQKDELSEKEEQQM